jgi:hypothetical protein
LLVAGGTRFLTCAAVNGDHAIGIASASNHFADMRDVMELGHCNFQFYDNAAGHYFSPAALLACRKWHPDFANCRSAKPVSQSPIPQSEVIASPWRYVRQRLPLEGGILS